MIVNIHEKKQKKHIQYMNVTLHLCIFVDVKITRVCFFLVVAYPSVCDSQQLPSLPTVPVAEGDARRLESQYVHQVYEEISSHFSSTRHSPWPQVRDFLLSLPPGSVLADIGCGNGKYLGINPEVMSVSNTTQQTLPGSDKLV